MAIAIHEQFKGDIDNGFQREMYETAGYFKNELHNFCGMWVIKR